jgi:hypothetical protein
MIGILKDARVRAKVLAGDEPIEWGRYLALDEALQEAGEPPVSNYWCGRGQGDAPVGVYLDFFRSGKTTFCAGKGQRAAGSTTCMRVAALPEVLLGDYTMASVSEPAWPIVSCDDTEAANRIQDLKGFLRKLGLTELPKRPKSAEKIGVGEGQFVILGGSEIHLLDCDGNPTKYSVTTRSVGGVSGFTGRSALCDEVDLWDERARLADEKPVAESVIQILAGRGLRQGDTKLYMLSRLFNAAGPLSTRCADGDNEERYIARQGEYGARLDVRARAYAKEYFERLALNAPNAVRRREYEKHAEDKRLTEDGDPRSYELPTWVCFGDDPERVMAECLRAATSASRTGDGILDELFGPYGSRARAGAWSWISGSKLDLVEFV